MRYLFAFLSILALTGCADDKGGGGGGTTDECGGSLMALPSGGYNIEYDLVDVTDGAEIIYYEDVEFTCAVTSFASGQSGGYCGFPIEVSADAFSFDTQENGGTDTDGAGDADGALIITDDGTYRFEYRITHLSEY
jgi:hypothetical protein